MGLERRNVMAEYNYGLNNGAVGNVVRIYRISRNVPCPSFSKLLHKNTAYSEGTVMREREGR